MSKEEFYKYGESLGISINDLQRLKMLADKCQEDMDKKYTEENIKQAIIYGMNTKQIDWGMVDEFIKSLNKQD